MSMVPQDIANLEADVAKLAADEAAATTPPVVVVTPPPTVTPGVTVKFGKGIVWQDDNAKAANNGVMDPTNPNVATIINTDTTTFNDLGAAWSRYWPSNSSLSALQSIFGSFLAKNINTLYMYAYGHDNSDEGGMIAQLKSLVPGLAAIGHHAWEVPANEANINFRVGGYWDTDPGVSAIGVNTVVDPAHVTASVTEWANHLHDSSATIRSLDPQAIIVSGAISNDPTYNKYAEIPSAVWNAEMSKPVYDIASAINYRGFHPYAQNGAAVVQTVQTDQSQISGPLAAVPVWLTEVGFWSAGYTIGGGQPGEVSTEAQRALEVTNMMVGLKALGIVTPVCYYNLYDYLQPTGYGFQHFLGGALRTNLLPYAAFKAFQP